MTKELFLKNLSDYRNRRDFKESYGAGLLLVDKDELDYETCFKAVQYCSFALKYIPEQFRTASIIEEAINKNSWAIIYAHPYEQTYNLCMKVVSELGRDVLWYISKEFFTQVYKKAEEVSELKEAKKRAAFEASLPLWVQQRNAEMRQRANTKEAILEINRKENWRKVQRNKKNENDKRKSEAKTTIKRFGIFLVSAVILFSFMTFKF